MRKSLILLITSMLIILPFMDIFAESESIMNEVAVENGNDSLDFEKNIFVFSDVKKEAKYYEDVARLWALGIITGNEAGRFKPDDMLTREQFAILMVRASGLEEKANLLKGSTGFPDIPSTRYSTGYINMAVSQGFLGAMPDGKFNPEQNITYAQVLTVLLRSLGYKNEDLTGVWPINYIEKAKSIGLTEDLEYGSNEAIPRWVAAMLFNRLLDTEMKESSTQQQSKTFGEYFGVCLNPELIILGNSATYKGIEENQIITSNGVFYLNINTMKYTGRELEMGRKYNITIVDDEAVWASKPLNDIKKITVISAIGNEISCYLEDKTAESIILSEKLTYYYNGSIQNFSTIKENLHQNSSIVFSYKKDRSGYDYACVFDPLYSKPEVKKDKSLSSSIGSITIDSASIPIIKNGQLIFVNEIKYGDVLYEVTDIWGKNKYILVNDNKVFGKIVDIVPNIVAANAIKIDDNAYNLCGTFDKSKISGGKWSFAVGDSVVALLGINGELVDIMDPMEAAVEDYAFLLNYSMLIPVSGGEENAVYTVKLFLADGTKATYKTDTNPQTMKGKYVKYTKLDKSTISLELPESIDETIVENISSAEGFYSECIILGDSKTFDNLLENQVLTDSGVLYNFSNDLELELGNKYKAVIDGDSILLVAGKTKILEGITVSSAIDNYITGKKQDMRFSMILPQKTVYYYNGVKQDYNNLKNILSANSTIIFACNGDKTGYDYAVIFDPVYSEPIINRSTYGITTKVGPIELKINDTIIKNNEIIDSSEIYYGDVVYEVTDIWGENRYIFVLEERERGVISAIKPNILSPQSIQLGNNTYEFDKNMDFSRIYGSDNPVKTGDTVTLLFGLDGKVVGIL